ncbi:MAG: amidohydrolase family protein [Acidobacteria bacterium]|nr:amidohydrolase family protein [Acidobacteriota bacterium]
MINKIKVFFTLLLLMVSLAGAPLNTAAQSNETYAIRNARIVTVTGAVIEKGTVVIAKGKIAAVGANVSVPSKARVIDATGLSVYPGLIDSGTTLGLEEIGSVAGGQDTAEIGDNNANLQVIVAVNPSSSHLPVARVNGITTALTAPQGGLIAGQSALINLAGWTWKEMALKTPVAMHINFPTGDGAGGRGGFDFGPIANPRSLVEIRREQDKQIDKLKTILNEAKIYGEAKDAKAQDSTLPKLDVDLKKEALLPVVRGQMPVVIEVQMARDIKKALEFADEMKLKIIISGGVEAYKVADLLKAKNIPVIIGPVLRFPANEDDAYDAPFTNASQLMKAGVKIAFQTSDSANSRNLPYHAGMAAAFGLSKEDALKALTIYPAEIWGVADKIGSIEVGKVANLIITDGDPLEIITQIKHLFINGHQVPLTSRHTELYEKYKARP